MDRLQEGRHVRPHPSAADVAIVGSGLAGSVAALALAARDVPVQLIGPKAGASALARDTRSTALFGPSVVLLERLGILPEIEGFAEPLVALRLVDDLGGILRAPEVLFEASEIGETAFGLNVENGPLLQALARKIEQSALVRWISTTVVALEPGDDGVLLRLADGEAAMARLVIGADGALSPSRMAAGIATRRWEYPQVAIACRFEHERPHRGISIELHRRAGPLTIVPLPGNWSGLVWVEAPAEAERLARLVDRDFVQELQSRVGALVGAIHGLGPRAAFPLSGVAAEQLGSRRIALVGEAAHRLPPIGAQGLNLGLRDIAWLADLVSEAIAVGRDPGAPELLDAYGRSRRWDVQSRTAIVDALNRSLIADFLPLDLARGGGMAAMKALGPLRRLLMREGMRPDGALPSLMRPLCET